MGSQAQDAALGVGFGLPCLPAWVIKAKHCALWGVWCVTVCLLPVQPRTSSASVHPCWERAGASSGSGCAVLAQHPPVEAACPGARLWHGQKSQGLALPFLCLWFQRNFLRPFLSGAFGNAALPGWARLGHTHLHLLDSSCQDLPVLRAGICIQTSAAHPRNLLPRGFAELRTATKRQEFSISCKSAPCQSRDLNWRGESDQKPKLQHTHIKTSIKKSGQGPRMPSKPGTSSGGHASAVAPRSTISATVPTLPGRVPPREE